MSSPTQPSPASVPPPVAEPVPLRSVHSTSFPELLAQFGLSVLVTTYQAGKLVLLRADGQILNTHFRSFDTPMGLAVHEGRLAIGTKLTIREYHDAPAVTARLEPPGKNDACYLPRCAHMTGFPEVPFRPSGPVRREASAPEKPHPPWES